MVSTFSLIFDQNTVHFNRIYKPDTRAIAAGYSLPPDPNEPLSQEPGLTEADDHFERSRMSISAFYSLSGSMICHFLDGKIGEPRVIGIGKN